jgi:hypothetical protein
LPDSDSCVRTAVLGMQEIAKTDRQPPAITLKTVQHTSCIAPEAGPALRPPCGETSSLANFWPERVNYLIPCGKTQDLLSVLVVRLRSSGLPAMPDVGLQSLGGWNESVFFRVSAWVIQ